MSAAVYVDGLNMERSSVSFKVTVHPKMTILSSFTHLQHWNPFFHCMEKIDIFQYMFCVSQKKEIHACFILNVFFFCELSL